MTAAARDTALGAKQVAIVRPGRGLFDLDLRAVWRYRELLFVLIKRDIQVLYKQAALGASCLTSSARIAGVVSVEPSSTTMMPMFRKVCERRLSIASRSVVAAL
jgi:hypothetical protein